MGKYKQYKNVISQFISSDRGQRFFNFAYSIGAAIVIWGALFKILHLPGGNFLLSLGMATEVLMFILTAFDRPPREYHWENVFPVFDSDDPEDRPDFKSGSGITINGGTATSDGKAVTTPVAPDITGASPQTVMAEMTSATQSYLDRITSVTAELQRLEEATKSLNQVSDTLLTSYRAITDNSDSISQASGGYVDQMQQLNRNISGLNTIYEIQLRSVSSQLDAIDRVNQGIKEIRDMYERSASQSTRFCEETERMASYMQQLNDVYAKVLRAMTINMTAAAPIAGANATIPPAPPTA